MAAAAAAVAVAVAAAAAVAAVCSTANEKYLCLVLLIISVLLPSFHDPNFLSLLSSSFVHIS